MKSLLLSLYFFVIVGSLIWVSQNNVTVTKVGGNKLTFRPVPHLLHINSNVGTVHVDSTFKTPNIKIDKTHGVTLRAK